VMLASLSRKSELEKYSGIASNHFRYIHFNRMIKKYDLDAFVISGPGHGAPGLISNFYLEGVWSETYPNSPENKEGMQRFFKQFSFPGGHGSHMTPEVSTEHR
jgi:xylulose-5-phosphate/fructose-6-phosphate phosphoketolase